MIAEAHALPGGARFGGRGRRDAVGAGWLATAARGRAGGGRHRPPFGHGHMPFPPSFFGPGGFRRGPRARRGDIRAAALLLLAEEARNGYQIMQELESRSGGVWRPSPGSVYPALAQLEDEGLVRAEEREGRRLFVLTDAGRAYVADRGDDLAAPWEEMSESVDGDVAALMGELRQVAIAAAMVARAGGARQVGEARRALAGIRRSLYAILADDELGAGGDEGA